jgi:hypothetical protein
MEIKIENINLLLSKKVPKQGKVSGIRTGGNVVRVIIPKEDTKLSLTVSELSEVLVRNITPDGKILGLTKFIGKNIYIIDQNVTDLEKETGTAPLADEWDEDANKAAKRLFEESEKYNIDPIDLLDQLIENYEKREKK